MTAKPDLSRPGRFLPALLLAFPALLLLPVLFYSLTTPFGLIDDYHDWQYAALLEDPGRLFRWLQGVPWGPTAPEGRYRPLWELYNAAAWQIFGPNPALHHLSRWLFHFAAIFCFVAAFWQLRRGGLNSRQADPAAAQTAGQPWLTLLPLVVLVYLWLFFPNAPAARLAPPEVHTAFFLGLCLWVLARQLARAGQPESRRAALLTYGLFFLGYCGVAWSKETNIALLPGLLLAWYVPILWARSGAGIGNSAPPPPPPREFHSTPGDANRPWNRAMLWPLLGGLPLALVFLHTLVKVYTAATRATYGIEPITPELLGANALWLLGQLFQVETSLLITAGLALLTLFLLGANALWLLGQLFQVETSLLITAGLALLTLFLLGWLGFRAMRRQWSGEGLFLLILLGLFVSMYLMICTSWEQVLRYWYPLIPLFAILLAFAAKFALAAAAEGPPPRLGEISCPFRPIVALLLAGFVLFFVAANYYNFLYQTVAQHYLRNADGRLLAEISRLQEQGQYVQVLSGATEPASNILLYFDQFLPRYSGAARPIYQTPPAELGHPYYIVNHTIQAPWPESYRLLAYARNLASVLQFGEPYWWLDGGVVVTWVWQVYASDLSAVWSNGNYLYQDWYEPAVRADYNLYHQGGYLIYRRESCGLEEDDRKFFAHIYPVDIADLPEWRQGHDFDNLDGIVETSRFRSGGQCFALLPLPTYPIRSVNTGQYVPEQGEVWSAELFLTLE